MKLKIKGLKTLTKKEQELINGGETTMCSYSYTVTCCDDGTYYLDMPNTGYHGAISEARAIQLCNPPQA